MRTANSFVGSAVERIEDLRFVRGRGIYVDDLACAGVLHAAILRSAVAHGRIRSLDTAAARSLPGVHAVITAADMGAQVPVIPIRLQPLPVIEPFHQPVIAHRKLRYVGEPIAVVLADSLALAEDALEAIVVDVESLPSVTNRRVSAKDEPLLFETHGTNLAIRYRAVRGEGEAPFREAAYTRRESFCSGIPP